MRWWVRLLLVGMFLALAEVAFNVFCLRVLAVFLACFAAHIAWYDPPR
jgi:hypothetical protein